MASSFASFVARAAFLAWVSDFSLYGCIWAVVAAVALGFVDGSLSQLHEQPRDDVPRQDGR